LSRFKIAPIETVILFSTRVGITSIIPGNSGAIVITDTLSKGP